MNKNPNSFLKQLKWKLRYSFILFLVELERLKHAITEK